MTRFLSLLLLLSALACSSGSEEPTEPVVVVPGVHKATPIPEKYGVDTYLCNETVIRERPTYTPAPTVRGQLNYPTPMRIQIARKTGNVINCGYALTPEEASARIREQLGPPLGPEDVVKLRIDHEYIQQVTLESTGEIQDFKSVCPELAFTGWDEDFYSRLRDGIQLEKGRILLENRATSRLVCRYYCTDIGQKCWQTYLFE